MTAYIGIAFTLFDPEGHSKMQWNKLLSWCMWARFDCHTYCMISRHIILIYSKISRDIPWYRDICHVITTYSMISRHIPWYKEIFRDIVIYSMLSRHIPWYHNIYFIMTYSIMSRHIPWYHIYSMISRYIPWYHHVFHDIDITTNCMISRYIPLHNDIFLMNLWNTSQYLFAFLFPFLPSFLFCFHWTGIF